MFQTVYHYFLYAIESADGTIKDMATIFLLNGMIHHRQNYSVFLNYGIPLLFLTLGEYFYLWISFMA
jgi:hypothetical protein